VFFKYSGLELHGRPIAGETDKSFDIMYLIGAVIILLILCDTAYIPYGSL
jgi:hypothetical protein